MGKQISADKVKTMPIGMEILMVRESTGQTIRAKLMQSYKKKLLQGTQASYDIKERKGWHYEVTE